jgi:D-alanyl-D-alanine carboxypeptidase
VQQNRQTQGAAGQRRLTREEWEAQRERRRRRRKFRNWTMFLVGCAATGVLVWGAGTAAMRMLPLVSSALTPQRTFEAQSSTSEEYVFNAQDPYLVLVNRNLPYTAAEEPVLAQAQVQIQADEEAGETLLLEATAAGAFRAMAAAAEADGISLRLVAGYEDAAATQAEFAAWEQKYLAEGLSEEEADARAATVAARPGSNEHETGLAADILADDYLTKDTGFADTEAFAWLRAYAADYGFILRYPEQRQSVTGVVYEPWHWRYVGVENARAIAASGVSLEEFIALQTQG